MEMFPFALREVRLGPAVKMNLSYLEISKYLKLTRNNSVLKRKLDV